MSRFLAVRYVAFALFVLLCGLTGSFAALNLGFMTSGVITLQVSVEALDIYLVAVSIINVVFIVPIVGTELYRKGALTSRIWFELLWVSAFFLAYLGGAIMFTMLVPNAVCNKGGAMKLACMTSIGLVAFAWISTSAYLIYFFTILAYCIIHSKPNFNIWNTSIVDHPWTPKPSLISHGSIESIDSRTTLTDTHIHAYNFKVQDDSSNLEKDLNAAVLPIYSQNTFAGPPTFGPSRTPGRRGAIDLVTANARAMDGQGMGVNAINGAPAYYAQQQDTYFNDQGPHKFHQNPRGNPESQNRNMDRNAYRSAEPAQGSRQAPWANTNDEETPSPAVITHAARVSQPSMSLYPAHIVATGLTTQSTKQPNQPERDPAMSNLLRAAGLSQSTTSLPYMKSSIGHGRESDLLSVRSGESEHSRSLSVDTVVQVNPGATEVAGHRRSTSGAREQKRGRRSGPRHKPPPLDLSSLSNIASADRRK